MTRMVQGLSEDVASQYAPYVEALTIDLRIGGDSIQLQTSFTLRRDRLPRTHLIAPVVDARLASDEAVVILRLFAQLEGVLDSAIAEDHGAAH